MNSILIQDIKFNKYLPIAIIYFFFNSFLLPQGLLYTAILTPVLLIWLYQYNSFRNIYWFFAFTLPFACIHLINGVDIFYYIKSYTLLFTAYTFSVCFYQFLKNTVTLRRIYKQILILNIIFVLVACIIFFIPSYRDVFWLTTHVSSGLEHFPRLKLLTYEPSYYSTLLAPIAIYYYLKIILFKLPNKALYFFLITFPLVISFSLGILLGIPIALGMLFLFNPELFFARRKLPYYIFIFLSAAILGILLLLLIYPDNPLFTRISNLFQKRDSSFRGRTSDAFYLAWTIAGKKSIWFGVGLGQIKLLGADLWSTFYGTSFSINEIAIPCAFADTLAVFGLVGAGIRIGLEIFFFFRTKVYTNYYRLSLFIFIFIYQFTGSYIYNIAEFAIWILAFNNTFSEFDRKNILVKQVGISNS